MPAPASYTPAHLAARIRASRTALEGERKLVTVLFADVVGSTAIAERIDPEEMRTLMDRCFGYMLEEVHRYEGTVNQFTGDGIMALFGAPLALEDAPRRAVLAALSMQRALARCRDEPHGPGHIDLHVRIGIHTGLVVVGRIGNDLRMEYTAIGDTTNLAARLQEVAPPGGVVVSEATHRLTAGFFEARDLGPHSLKGKSEPVRVFQVTAESAAQGRIDTLTDTGLTPLAGREGELRTLHDAFDAACRSRGQTVFVVGEAGIGKSRLLYEFRRRLADTPHTWVEGRCASYGTTTAFLPLIDALRRTFGIEDRDDEAAAAAKVDAGIAPLGPDVAWTVPFVRQLLALPPDDEAVATMNSVTRRSETFRALKTLTLETARVRPLVLLIEDLHWIDPASEEYLTFLADVVPATHALLMCSYRPGYQHVFGDRSYHVRVPVRPLSDAEMARVASAALGVDALPAEVAALIAEKADGNALFVEEVSKALVEDGSLRRDGDRVTLGRALADLAVPDSIHGVLMARIDRLDDDPKHALQMASIIGREFALRLLARVSEVGDRVPHLVQELRALEIIYEKAEHPELAYIFKHALVHDVAYESVLLEQRRRLHRLVGSAIEELYAERLPEHYETLALHFTRGEDWERALTYHTLAARKAAEAYANHAVIAHARAGLGILDRLATPDLGPRRQELEELIGMASLLTSAFRASGEAFVRAADAAPEPGARAIDLGHAGQSFTWAHAYDDARRVLEQAGELARVNGLVVAETLAVANDGFLHQTLGELDAAERLFETAVAIAERSGSEEARAVTQLFHGVLLDWRGDFRRSAPLFVAAREVGQRRRLPHLVVLPQWFLGKATCGLGEYARSVALLRDAVELCDKIGDRAWKTRCQNTLGWCLAEIGAHAAALEENRRAAALAHEIGDQEIRANAELNLAANHLALGDVDAAFAHVEPIRAEFEPDGDPWLRWRVRMHVQDVLGQLMLARREPARALAHADAELSSARHHRAAKLEARALELRGRTLVALDCLDEAEASLRDALAAAAHIGYPPIQWRALGLLAEIARRRGRRTEAETHVARVTALIRTLGASLPDDLRQALHAVARFEQDARR